MDPEYRVPNGSMEWFVYTTLMVLSKSRHHLVRCFKDSRETEDRIPELVIQMV